MLEILWEIACYYAIFAAIASGCMAPMLWEISCRKNLSHRGIDRCVAKHMGMSALSTIIFALNLPGIMLLMAVFIKFRIHVLGQRW